MSSSDAEAPRRFVKGLLSSAMMAAVIIAAINFAADPYEYWRGATTKFCEPMAGRGVEAQLKPSIPAIRDANVVYIGSSRVLHGFDRETLQEGHRDIRPANLGSPAPDLQAFLTLAYATLDAPSVERIALGLDFGMFYRGAGDGGARSSLNPAFKRLKTVLATLVSLHVTAASLQIIQHGSRCFPANMTADGFDSPALRQRLDAEPDYAEKDPRRTLALILPKLGSSPQEIQATLLTSDFAVLSRFMERAIARHVSVEIFISPSRPDYFESLERSNLRHVYGAWQTSLAEWAKQASGKPVFADFTGMYSNASTNELAAAFYDPVHFKPAVGARIVEHMARLRAVRP